MYCNICYSSTCYICNQGVNTNVDGYDHFCRYERCPHINCRKYNIFSLYIYLLSTHLQVCHTIVVDALINYHV